MVWLRLQWSKVAIVPDVNCSIFSKICWYWLFERTIPTVVVWLHRASEVCAWSYRNKVSCDPYTPVNETVSYQKGSLLSENHHNKSRKNWALTGNCRRSTAFHGWRCWNVARYCDSRVAYLGSGQSQCRLQLEFNDRLETLAWTADRFQGFGQGRKRPSQWAFSLIAH